MDKKQTRQRVWGLIIGGAVGNLIEWYNFLLYAFLAGTISELFFKADDPMVSLMLVYSLFAVGFLARPFGSLLFGYIGDKYGRKCSLILSLLLMAVPTFCIALLPTYAQWGVISPLILVLLRIAQGVSIGGEYTGSVIFLGEHAPIDRRALWVSSIPMTTALGILCGLLVSLLTVKCFSSDELLAWGWRVPFIVGGILCLVGVRLRMRLPETPVFKRLRQDHKVVNNSLYEILGQSKIRTKILQLIVLVSCYGVFYQTLFIWMPTYLQTVAHYSKSLALEISGIHMLVFLLLLPVCGWLSDQVGRKILIMLSIIGLLISSFPLFHLISEGGLWEVNLAMACFTVLFSIYAASLTTCVVELFPGQVRYTALSFGYNIAFAVFGGTAPLVLTWLISVTHNQTSPAYYLVICALCASVVCLRVADQRGQPI